MPLTWENTDCLDLYPVSGRDTLKVKRTSGAVAQEAAWSRGLLVRAEGRGTVAHAGVVLPRLLADRVGLTAAFRDVLARPGSAVIEDGDRQVVLRVLGEYADRLGEGGLPGRRLAEAVAKVRVRAWEQIVARHGALPAVKVAGAPLSWPGQDAGTDGVVPVVIRLDATVIQAASGKEGAEANYKGFGFHPLTAWCSNTGR